MVRVFIATEISQIQRDGANAFDKAGGNCPMVRAQSERPTHLLLEAGEARDRLNEAAA